MRNYCLILIVAAALLLPSMSFSHCQVPCGIYDDAARIEQMVEDTKTIRKALKRIAEHEGKVTSQDLNQFVRWVNTKEVHASHIITTVAEYFLTQKVKPVAAGEEGYEAYLTKLAAHHAVMRAAMKTKQSTDEKHVDALRDAIQNLVTHYDTSDHDHGK